MTVSNPVFDHTLPFVEKFYGENWAFPGKAEVEGTMDSLGVDLALKTLESLPTDSLWFFSYNTIASHIPFYGYPDSFASKPDDAMERYKNALRYTDSHFGRFLSALSKRPDFKNTVIIMTSNIGAREIARTQPMGFGGSDRVGLDDREINSRVMSELKKLFRPEFLNRLDEIVFYKPLTKDNVTKIIDLQIAKLNERLQPQQIRVELTEAAKLAIVEASYDPQYGARPLRRYVQHTVETMLSKRLLRGEVLPGQTVTVDVQGGELIFQ